MGDETMIPCAICGKPGHFEVNCPTIGLGATLAYEIHAILEKIPLEFRVRVCESGGPENEAASLAVSVAKMTKALTAGVKKFVGLAYKDDYDDGGWQDPIDFFAQSPEEAEREAIDYIERYGFCEDDKDRKRYCIRTFLVYGVAGVQKIDIDKMNQALWSKQDQEKKDSEKQKDIAVLRELAKKYPDIVKLKD